MTLFQPNLFTLTANRGGFFANSAFALLKLGDNTLKFHEDLVKVLDGTTSSHTTVRRWHALFLSENKDNKADTPSARLKTAKLVKEDMTTTGCLYTRLLFWFTQKAYWY